VSEIKKTIYRLAYGKTLAIGCGTHFRSSVSLNVEKAARLSIGKNCFFNNNCIINAHENIQIGEGTFLGPNVVIYDHDHDYRNNMNEYIAAPIMIGKHCWIGANTIILKGTHIGDNVVVAAGSVVSKEVPANVVYVQKRKRTIIEK
jgi:acetyltransferase-like isoleucine patch superfamily enzyme